MPTPRMGRSRFSTNQRLRPKKSADEDPLSAALRPPANETEQQRVARISREEEAKKVCRVALFTEPEHH